MCQNVIIQLGVLGGLTADIEGKVGPAVIEEDSLAADLDFLNLAHGPWSGTKVLEIGDKFDQASDESDSQMSSETLMGSRAVA